MLTVELCVEISLPYLDKNYVKDGSGYTIAPGLVLTAYHVLFGKGIDEDIAQVITLVWRDAPAEIDGSKPPYRKIERKEIIWFDKSLDLALIRCEIPPLGVEIPRAEAMVARSKPASEEIAWKSRGFFSLLEDGNRCRDVHDPSGIVGTLNPDEPITSIKVTAGALDNEELWAGISGAPVFVNQKLSAIVLKANRGRRGASLRVVFVCHALDVVAGPEQKSFAELIGLDLSIDYIEDLRKWFNPKFVHMLSKSDSVEEKAREAFYTLNPNTALANTKALADYLVDGTPVQCVDFVKKLYEHFEEERNSVENTTLHNVTILMMTLLFPQHEAVTTIIASRNKDEPVIDSVTATKIETETAMAAADGNAPEINYQSGYSSCPYNVSPNEARCGLEGGNGLAVKDVAEYLVYKGVPGDVKKVIENVWEEVRVDNDDDESISSLETIDEKLDFLAWNSKTKSRSFYVVLPAGTEAPEVVRWGTLKRWFSGLDLIKLKKHSDLETVKLFKELKMIILETQGGKY